MYFAGRRELVEVEGAEHCGKEEAEREAVKMR